MKRITTILLVLVMFFASINVVYAADPDNPNDDTIATTRVANDSKNPCVRLKEPLKMVGYVVLVIKIIVPLALIIFGMIDLFKAVTSGKDGEIMKSVKSLAFRVVAGVCIFLLPTIINLVFNLVGNFSDVKSEYSVCQRCILNVNKCE